MVKIPSLFPVFWVNFPPFSSILGKIPGLFQSVQNSLTGKSSPIFPGFPIFPVHVGTMTVCFIIFMYA